MDSRLRQRLDEVASRIRAFRIANGLATVFFIGMVSAIVLLVGHFRAGWQLGGAMGMLFFGAIALSGVLWALVSRTARNQRRLAQRVEHAYPKLDACLLSAMEQRPNNGQRLGYLQESVVDQAIRHSDVYDWRNVISTDRMFASGLASGLSLFGFLIATVLMAWFSLFPGEAASSRLAENLKKLNTKITVEPGTTEIERGKSLLVMARFSGDVPAEVALSFVADAPRQAAAIEDSASGESVGPSLVAMSKSLQDPVFGGRIPAIQGPLDYSVTYDGQQTESYRVTVFEFPRLVRADAELSFPEYTDRENKLVQDVRKVTVVQGTKIRMMCSLNKSVTKARLVDRGEKEIMLSPSADDPLLYVAEFQLMETTRCELRLEDDQGRQNKQPPQFVFAALENALPDLRLAFPSRDMQVSPIEEVRVRAQAWDDFGVKRVGLSYTLAGKTPQEVVLGQNMVAKAKSELEHTMELEKLSAEPDELLAYHLWAEDAGPDGEVRRVMSDMYFAEVRHFEEIFRQGQQPPGGQQQQQQGGGGARAVDELTDLQKEIINATWKIIRRETSDEPSSQFVPDVSVVADGQAQAIEKAEEAKEKVQSRDGTAAVDEVIGHMTTALDHLTRAHETPDLPAMGEALTAEQEAYQALLRLRAREHNVIQGQQQQQSQQGSAANRSRQQLNQLELKNDKNRYEAERQAQLEQEESQLSAEQRDVLARLRELAQRQHDLNERVKELQSALEAAQDEQERKEIEEQLERLREEQEQILRDTDDLSNRMQQSDQRQQMSDAQKQLEQTRDQVRQAAEALEEKKVSQAAAAGARAEEQFEDLREDFRKSTGDRFQEEMKDLQQKARELDDQQKDVQQKIAELNKPQQQDDQPSLGGNAPRKAIGEQLKGQQERLAELLQELRNTIQTAEEPEPLLAEKLYDTARTAEQQQLDEALQMVKQAVEVGLDADATEIEQVANKGIEDLRKGIEQAAESVLGDESDALRRARDELRELSDQLNKELARNNETPRNQPQQGQQQQGQQQQGQQQQGQQQQGQQQQGQQQQGQQQQGQQQQGQQQQGQQQQGQQQQGQQQQGQQQQGQQQQGQQQQGQQQQGQQQQGQQQQGQQQQGQQQQGQPQQGQQPSDQQQAGQRQQGGSQRDRSATNSRDEDPFGDLLDQWGGGGGNPAAPIAGEDYREWMDRMQDVEEMLDDDELRAEVARLRDRVRGVRIDLKRHSKEPNWELVRVDVGEPLNELVNRVQEELIRKSTEKAIVPVDRDPVPSRFTRSVQRYYEKLGTGELAPGELPVREPEPAQSEATQ